MRIRAFAFILFLPFIYSSGMRMYDKQKDSTYVEWVEYKTDKKGTELKPSISVTDSIEVYSCLVDSIRYSILNRLDSIHYANIEFDEAVTKIDSIQKVLDKSSYAILKQAKEKLSNKTFEKDIIKGQSIFFKYYEDRYGYDYAYPEDQEELD